MAFSPGGRNMKAFLSCVSREFKSYRLKLANHLGALKGAPFTIKVQEDFQQGGDTLLDQLAAYLQECDLVVHLVGQASGARPAPRHVATLFTHLGESPPEPIPEWSYTQWEYQLARRFGKKVLVYWASDDAPRDCGSPVAESEDDARLQHSHQDYLRASGEHYKPFCSHHELLRELFYDLGLEADLKVNNLPYKSLGALFKGRDAFLDQLRTTLGQADFRGHQRVAAITAAASTATIHGLGGVGKTRAAIEFAHRHAADYTAMLFVTADSPQGLQQNLAGLCGSLVLNLPEKDERETEVQVAAVLQWLQRHPGWFLIFDNVDNDEAADAVQQLLTRMSPAGQVLITSRLSNWPGAVEALALDVLAESDAADFLLLRTESRRRKTPDDASQARGLVVELGQLALALEQAGAYIEKHRLTIAQYHDHWRGRRDQVLAWFDPRLMQYPVSVAVTWQTSFDRLAPPARRLLHELAWFAPDPIPEWLLESGGGPFAQSAEDGSAPPPDAYEALADLEAYSLVMRADQSATFSVHRLVQDVTRRSLQGVVGLQSLRETLRWIDDAFVGHPGDVRIWSTLDPLAPHVETTARHADQGGIANPTGKLMGRVAGLRLVKAQYAEAEPLMRRGLAIVEQQFGLDHPDVARDLNRLATLLQDTNRLTEAEALWRRALAINEKHLGPDHPEVATVLNNLAWFLDEASRFAEAEPLVRRALMIDEQSSGPQHPHVARDLNTLSHLLLHTNRFAEAEPLMRRALAIGEHEFGPDHTEVAMSLNTLARLLLKTSQFAEAEPLLRRALAITEQRFGPDHPDVAINLTNLAWLLHETGRLAEAEPLLRRALTINEQRFGPDHPDVATALENLAKCLRETNRLTEAESVMRRALAIDEKNLGPDHPNVATSLRSLAQLLWQADRLTEAEPLLRRALAIGENSVGVEHPNVASDLTDLAFLLHDAKRLTEAEPLLQRALAIDERHYGPDHPNVARDLNNAATLLTKANRLAEAERLARRAVDILLKFKRTTGNPHPKFAAVRETYASVLSQMGRDPKQVLSEVLAEDVEL